MGLPPCGHGVWPRPSAAIFFAGRAPSFISSHSYIHTSHSQLGKANQELHALRALNAQLEEQAAKAAAAVQTVVVAAPEKVVEEPEEEGARPCEVVTYTSDALPKRSERSTSGAHL